MKILESEFRRELYKNLIEAGYDKNESQKIVAVKYGEALKNKILSNIVEICNEMENNIFNPLTDEWFTNLNADISEINKTLSMC